MTFWLFFFEEKKCGDYRSLSLSHTHLPPHNITPHHATPQGQADNTKKPPAPSQTPTAATATATAAKAAPAPKSSDTVSSTVSDTHQPVVLASALAFTSLKEKRAAQEQRRHQRLAKEHDRARRRRLREGYRLLMSGRMRRAVEAALGIVPTAGGGMGEDDDEGEEEESGESRVFFWGG